MERELKEEDVIYLYLTRLNCFDQNNELATLLPILILSDVYFYFGAIASLLYNRQKLAIDVDNPNKNELFIKCYIDILKHKNETEKNIKNHIYFFNLYKKLRLKKNKTPKEIQDYAQHNSYFRKMKKTVCDFYDLKIIPFNGTNVDNFIAEGSLIVAGDMVYKEDNEQEDNYIDFLAPMFSFSNSVVVFSGEIRQYFTCALASETDVKGTPDKPLMIVIPILDFPPMTFLTYEEMNYTKQSMIDIKTYVIENFNKISEFTETIDTMEQVQEKLDAEYVKPMEEKLLSFQDKIDNSVYLKPICSQTKKILDTRISFVITNLEYLMNMYVKFNIMEAFVAAIALERICDRMPKEQPIVFMITEVNTPTVE